MLACVFYLLYLGFILIFGSNVINYPYPPITKGTKIPKTVVQAGSFNPPHRGHIEILKYLSNTYEKVYIVIGLNPSKNYPVSPEDRASMLKDIIVEEKLDNVQVRIW